MRARLLLTIAVTVSLGLSASGDEIRGLIRKVDIDHQQLIVSGRGRQARGKEFTFQLTADTRIVLGKNAVKVKDLQPGQRVRVQFDTRDNVDVALQVSAMPKGAGLRAGVEKADGILRMIDWLLKQREGTPPSK